MKIILKGRTYIQLPTNTMNIIYVARKLPKKVSLTLCQISLDELLHYRRSSIAGARKDMSLFYAFSHATARLEFVYPATQQRKYNITISTAVSL